MQINIQANNQEQIFDINQVAKQAAGAVMLKVGKAVILATIARDENQVSEDFLPLTVQYIEKQYAAGKIPGGYIKRETKPGEFETLTSRIIDRSLRPLFPKGYAYPTQITVLVLSADSQVDLQVIALNAASAALFLSDIPVNRNVCGVRVACVDENFVLNPSLDELKQSTLDLYLAGVDDELLMIEMRSLPSKNEISAIPVVAMDSLIDIPANFNQNMNEFSEEKMLMAIEFGTQAIANGSKAYNEAFKAYKKADAIINLKPQIDNLDAYELVRGMYGADVKSAINQMAKSERASELSKIAQNILQSDICIAQGWSETEIVNALNKYKKEVVRAQILNEGLRADGRKLDEVRPISIQTNILPSAHGSCLFTRGQTQALVVATLGNDNDVQMSELLTQKTPVSEKFMFNYNFPGFSVGEASQLKAPGRRELGHGNLAKRALYPSIDVDLPQSIRLVSEILESNGSSSMASVCGGALALRAAGIASIKLVAGVAMGLVLEDDKYAILTDIMGLEDHDGDMDFKVAGTHEGITALQMDIKLGGISMQILSQAFNQAKQAREHILNIMEEANRQIIINEDVLPKLELFSVDPSKIVDIIGQAGKTIKEIIEKFGVSVDLDRDKGEVKIAGDEQKNVRAAKDYIIEITQKDNGRNFKSNFKSHKPDISAFSVGAEFDGVVKTTTNFGAFIAITSGSSSADGLLHISKIKNPLKTSQSVRVKIAEIKNGKISLDLL